MFSETTDPSLKSFIEVHADNHFPIQNLPYGVFTLPSLSQPHIGVAIGEYILDLFVLCQESSFFDEFEKKEVFLKQTLNDFMSLGKESWSKARKIISSLLQEDNPHLRDNKELKNKCLVAQKDATMVLPVSIGDYTDFYSSIYHATNVGIMFRGRENALQPNWRHLPVGYHGRASSIVLDQPVRRPNGQIFRKSDNKPLYTSCKRLDYELEMGFLIGPGNNIGDPIDIKDADKHIFGLVLVNDWSARDIQKWEYVPLGPFNAKNFLTTISPWVVTIEALEPFIIAGEPQDPIPVDYLQRTKDFTFNIDLEVYISTEKMDKPYLLSKSNCKYLYWSIDQQLVHHTVTGCNLRTGDLLASGTISGPEVHERGCLLELSWDEQKGSVPIKLPDGETRTFLEDGDTITFNGYANGNGYKIGFGTVSGKVIPAHDLSVKNKDK